MSGIDPESSEPTLTKGKKFRLTDQELQHLDQLYLELVPRYGYLCEAYEKAAKVAKDNRRKCVFPPRTEWQPPFPISKHDKELLSGPQDEITTLKKQYVEDSNTKRKIVFTSAESENVSSRTKCSYVAINSDSTSCRLGRIVKLVQHEFASMTFNLAIVHEYQSKCFDDNSELWWVDPKLTEVAIMQLSMLSHPLVVAADNDRLWFLNVNKL